MAMVKPRNMLGGSLNTLIDGDGKASEHVRGRSRNTLIDGHGKASEHVYY